MKEGKRVAEITSTRGQRGLHIYDPIEAKIFKNKDLYNMGATKEKQNSQVNPVPQKHKQKAQGTL